MAECREEHIPLAYLITFLASVFVEQRCRTLCLRRSARIERFVY